MRIKIFTRRYGEPEEFHTARQLARRRRRAFGHPDTRIAVQERSKRFTGKFSGWQMRQKRFDIYKHCMAARRTHHRNAILQALPEISDLIDAAFDITIRRKNIA